MKKLLTIFTFAIANSVCLNGEQDTNKSLPKLPDDVLELLYKDAKCCKDKKSPKCLELIEELQRAYKKFIHDTVGIAIDRENFKQTLEQIASISDRK